MAYVSIRQKYDGLKAFLLPGVFNLTSDELITAVKVCDSLIIAIPQVMVDFDQEDDKRQLLAQIKIIKRQLDQISTPTFTAQIVVGSGTDLYSLALEHLGDALRWNEIAVLNNLSDPYITEITTLQLPVK